MSLPEIADIVQAVNLIGFVAAMVFCLYIGWRWKWARMWLLPLAVYTFVSALFYTAVVFNLFSIEARTVWSASLRLSGVILIMGGLTAMCWMLRDRDKRA